MPFYLIDSNSYCRSGRKLGKRRRVDPEQKLCEMGDSNTMAAVSLTVDVLVEIFTDISFLINYLFRVPFFMMLGTMQIGKPGQLGKLRAPVSRNRGQSLQLQSRKKYFVKGCQLNIEKPGQLKKGTTLYLQYYIFV